MGNILLQYYLKMQILQFIKDPGITLFKTIHMRKSLIKNSPSKKRPANADKNKNSDSDKKNAVAAEARKKSGGNLIHILNYQYQDSDLEQFVF